MSNTKWINGAIEVLQGKNGGYYVNVKKDLTLTKGQRIMLKDFEQNTLELAEKGIITESEANERIAKLSFVKYVGSVAPLETNSNF